MDKKAGTNYMLCIRLTSALTAHLDWRWWDGKSDLMQMKIKKGRVAILMSDKNVR